jgi:hypothetical protein
VSRRPACAGLRARLAAVAALAWAAAPDAALACSVCGGADSPAVRQAFLWTTGFLTVLPLGLLGGFLWWLRRRVRGLERERDARAAASGQGEAAPGRSAVGASPR